MITETYTEKIHRAVALFKNSNYVVSFTGAGISTESGIPDFRSPDSGLWQGADPMETASIFGFKKNPQNFYNWVRPLAKTTMDAQPNLAHMALARLEQIGYLKSIITQNIDMLHTRAGNKTVHELHGHMREATCISCFSVFDGEPILLQFIEDGIVPHCPNCQGVIKPNVILFGEQLPIQVFQAAQKATRESDLMIIIGSSLEVAPASDIPLLATYTGAKLIIINLEPTMADNKADVVINTRAAQALPDIVWQLENS